MFEVQYIWISCIRWNTDSLVLPDGRFPISVLRGWGREGRAAPQLPLQASRLPAVLVLSLGSQKPVSMTGMNALATQEGSSALLRAEPVSRLGRRHAT